MGFVFGAPSWGYIWSSIVGLYLELHRGAVFGAPSWGLYLELHRGGVFGAPSWGYIWSSIMGLYLELHRGAVFRAPSWGCIWSSIVGSVFLYTCGVLAVRCGCLVSLLFVYLQLFLLMLLWPVSPGVGAWQEGEDEEQDGAGAAVAAVAAVFTDVFVEQVFLVADGGALKEQKQWQLSGALSNRKHA